MEVLYILLGMIIVLLVVLIEIVNQNKIDYKLFLLKVFERFDKMLVENKNDNIWSSTRFVFIITSLSMHFFVISFITYLYVKNGKLLSFQEGELLLYLYGISMGIVSIAKNVQKWAESKSDNSVEKNKTTNNKPTFNDSQDESYDESLIEPNKKK